MNLLKKSQTNWKYILIVVILAFVVGGILWFLTREEVSLEFPEIERLEKVVINLPPKGYSLIFSAAYPCNSSWSILFIQSFCFTHKGIAFMNDWIPIGAYWR